MKSSYLEEANSDLLNYSQRTLVCLCLCLCVYVHIVKRFFCIALIETLNLRGESFFYKSNGLTHIPGTTIYDANFIGHLG